MTTVVPPMGHAAALDLAAAAPAFPLSSAEARDLREHLRDCPDCSRRAARMRTDLAALGRIDPAVSPRLHDRIREIAVTQPRRGPSPLGLIAVLGLLALGVVGASAGIIALASPRPVPVQAAVPVLPTDPDDQIDWRTDVVALAARQFSIEADGRTFRGVTRPSLISDPGDPTRWTFEATWLEQGREQRLFLYFAADDAAWWLDEVRTYDGAAESPKWATFAQPRPHALMRTALGQAFSGDVTLEGTSATGDVTLHLDGVRVAVSPKDNVTEPIGETRKVLRENGNPAVDGDPFGPGGPLVGSCILQMTPSAAELILQVKGYATSWRWVTRTSESMGESEPLAHAPSSGFISGTAVGSQGELILFVDNPASAFAHPPLEGLPGC